jgi:hypothetical protein
MTSTGSRHEGDTRDLASSVGVTATMVAAALYPGERNEVAPYLTSRGWSLATIPLPDPSPDPLPELRAASGLAPGVDQDLPAVEMLCISGTLPKQH